MTTKNQIYRCSVCGNIVEVIYAGNGELVCCGQPMELLQGKTEDTGFEKHLPVIERSENTVTVKIGSVPHPMEEAHYIELIEIIADDKVYKKFLKPGDAPEAVFEISADSIAARAYCNVHGLWQTK
ncbi:MAG: desulfoferrodoxin [Candidatus Shapirobacteria bacterium]|nr:desulfoferrodoxin [Candidatus Shapirobacteria bacterium]